MREIKFRAWDKRNKEMRYQGQEDVFNDFEDILNFLTEIWEYVDCEEDKKNFELMQFIGLKDKNGKEIYEGDVIVCRDGKYVIEYVENFAQFVMTNKDIIRTPKQLSEQDANTCMRSIEVIGNKFENPELLK